jgi:hypothetical protein
VAERQGLGTACPDARAQSQRSVLGITIERARQLVEKERDMIDTVLVCIAATADTAFDDNVHGECSMCGTRIQWRPHAPDVPKVCMGCASPMTGKVTVTEETMRELLEHFRKSKN